MVVCIVPFGVHEWLPWIYKLVFSSVFVVPLQAEMAAAIARSQHFFTGCSTISRELRHDFTIFFVSFLDAACSQCAHIKLSQA